MTTEIVEAPVIKQEKIKREIHRFKPGNPGGPGRPKGATDKKWASLQYWFEKIEADFDSLEARDRVKIAVDLFLALLARKQLPPETPEESVENAKRIQDELNSIASGSRAQAFTGSGPLRVDNGTAGIQVPPNPVEVR